MTCKACLTPIFSPYEAVDMTFSLFCLWPLERLAETLKLSKVLKSYCPPLSEETVTYGGINGNSMKLKCTHWSIGAYIKALILLQVK